LSGSETRGRHRPIHKLIPDFAALNPGYAFPIAAAPEALSAQRSACVM
jgi:hypothetical protein